MHFKPPLTGEIMYYKEPYKELLSTNICMLVYLAFFFVLVTQLSFLTCLGDHKIQKVIAYMSITTMIFIVLLVFAQLCCLNIFYCATKLAFSSTLLLDNRDYIS